MSAQFPIGSASAALVYMQRTVAPAQQIIQVYVGTGQGRVIRQQADMGTRMGAILYRTLSLTGDIRRMSQVYFYLTDSAGHVISPYATASEYAVPIEPEQPDSPMILKVYLNFDDTGRMMGPICTVTIKGESGMPVPIYLPTACTVGQAIMVVGFEPQQAMVLDGNARWVELLVTLGQLHALQTSALLVLSHQRWANGMIPTSVCRGRRSNTELEHGTYSVRVNFQPHPANSLVTISTVGATNGETWNTCTTLTSSAPHSPGLASSADSALTNYRMPSSSGFICDEPEPNEIPDTWLRSATASSSNLPWQQEGDNEDGGHSWI